MEMAAAHGLAQRLVEMTGLDRVNRNELHEIISEEDNIIRTWFALSKHQIFRKEDFFNLLRKTLVFVLTESPLKEIKKKELLKVVSIYFNTFSSLLKNVMDIRKHVIDIILEPWKNIYFSWDEFFQRKLTLRDIQVQDYFHAEPEEIVLARVHVFLKQGKEEMAMSLAKTSFMFHSRVANDFSKYQHINQKKNLLSDKCKKGTASMDWYLFILQKKRNLPSIFNEIKQLTCHEGLLLIQRLRQYKNQSFAFTILQILFMQELIRPSKFCCTKKIFCLWSLMHKEKNTSMDSIIQDIRKMVAMYAPSSAHFYLLVDALWKQFGSSFITVYVELYVRGLTVDINHLEVAKNGEVHEDVSYLECHIASMFAKLSTLFSDFHDGAARECMFSAFSLKPTKERLYILQSLTHSILSTENEIKLKSQYSGNSVPLQECKCAVRCSGSCNSTKEYFLEHPILMKGIPNVPYSVVRDLVCVLEGVRCIRFQYNLFDWHNNATDIGDYLNDFNADKSWESETEYASDGSVKSDSEENLPINDSVYPSTQMEDGLLQPPAKRKCETEIKEETFALDARANIEIANDEFINKRIKIEDQNMNNEISTQDIFNPLRKPLQDYSSPLGMEDAIENVIRMTLDNNRQKSDLLNNGQNISQSLNHVNDGTENLSLSSVYKPVSENHVYPYSLTTYGKKTNLNSNFKASDCSSSLKSSHENSAKYVSSFASKSSCLSQILTTPVISRESVISPTANKPIKLPTMQEQSCTQVAQNKFYPIETQSVSCYSRSNETSSSTVNSIKKIPVYHQEALNLGSKNSMYEQQARSSSSTITQSSQFITNQTTMQVLSVSDVSKTQFLSNAPIASSCSMTSPVNVIQSKDAVAVQHAGYPSSSQCVSKSSVYRADSRYQVDKNRMSNTVVKRVEQSISCFQDNNFAHCDRSSVIQHTMQHLRESPMQMQPDDNEIPNQLSVSVNSNAIKQIRNVPKNDISNLPPFTVNVSDRAISNSSVAVSASLVIPRKPQIQVDQTSQTVSRNLASVNNSETITIPGILASQSVIVSPWEAQRKSHGELMYKKNVNAINASSIEKRIYKNRPPHGRLFKPEPKVCALQVPRDNNSNTQDFKPLAHPSHISAPIPALPSSNKNNSNTSQVWSYVNNSSSSGVSRPTSSQPWYSEPYPKPHNSGKNIPKSSVGLNLTIPQNALSAAKPSQLAKPVLDVKSLAMFTKLVHPCTSSSISSVVSHKSNNRISSSSTTSSVLNNIFSSSNSNPQAVSSENVVRKDFVPSSSPSFNPNNRVNMKVYSGENNPAKKSFVDPLGQPTSAMQLTASAVKDKNPVHYVTSVVHGSNLQYSPITSRNCSPCCSPSEVNPCQNCSLPAGNSVVQSTGGNISDRLPEQIPPGGNKMISNDLASEAPSDSKASNNDGHVLSNANVNSTVIQCQYCSHSFIASELEMHLLKSHSKEFSVKNNAFITQINSDSVASEKLCTANNKSLPLVPEQDSLFLKESFNSDLPHKTFVNSVENQQSVIDDDKNLDEIEAFSACMDLINSDKDLKRIVQGIDSFHQMDNNYLSFVPTNESNNFLTPNLCSGVQEAFVSNAPMQNPTVNNEREEVNNFSGCQGTGLPERAEVNKALNCIFEFTDKEIDSSKSVQKLIHSKLQSTYSEKLSAHTPMKSSNELTFSTLAEMIKVTIGGESDNDLESVGAPKDIQKDLSQVNGSPQREWCCSLCSKKVKSSRSLKRHMKLHSAITTTIDNSQKDTVPKLLDISSATVPKNIIQFENETASKSDNSYNDSSDSINHITQPDVKQNLEAVNVSQNCAVLLPKGRIKGIIKSPTTPCKFCNKVLTSVYMKKHILKQHPEIVKKTDNSSSDINTDVNVSSPSQTDSGNIASLSSLLEQDIDSSTCLSVSDALKRNNPYTVTETYSDDKLTEETDIKFNFNVLEFSKDTKIQSTPLVSEEITSPNLGQIQPSSIMKLDEEKIKGNAPNNDIKPISKHHCPLCTKSYITASGLNRHLRSIHKVIQQRKCMVTNSVGLISSVKNVNENQLPCKYFNKSSNSNEDSIQIPNNETTQRLSEEHPIQSISTSGIARDVDQNARERSKVFSHNPHRTLLRTVLQSNFISQQRKDYKGISDKCDAPFDNGRANSCDTSGEDKEQLREHLKNISYSPEKTNYKCLKGGTLDHELKSDTKNCTSVPFNSSSNIHLTANSTAHSSLSSQIEISHKELDNTDKVIQIKCTPPTDSQNLSIQSNEISPISEIISNVSKCHFGGASNIDKREYFEDNSLKLLIPENDNDSSLSSKNDENILQPDKPKLIQNNKLVQQKEGDISEESCLSSGKLNNFNADDHCSEEKIHEKDSPALASSACKLNNRDTNCGYGNQNLVDSMSVHLQEVNYQKFPVLKEISISEESDVSLKNLNDSAVNSEEEILGESSCDLDSSVQDYADKSNRCRLCHQYLSSLDILSQHLKDIHDIPVLKKHISHPSSSELSHCFREPDKLSPPKLKLGTNESDSESVSGYDNRCSSSKMTSGSSELETTQKESFTEPALQNLCTLVPPLLQQGDHDDETILQNPQSKLKKNFVHLELDKTEVELDQSGLVTLQPSNYQHSKPEYLLTTAFSASLSKWTSLCDIYSNFNKDLNPLFKNTKYLFLDSKNLSLKGTRQKCTSLPNIKLSDYQTPDYNEMKHNTSDESNHLKKIHNQKFPELKEISVNISEENKHSTEENTTLSSVTDNTEICKSSCDSLSAQNFPVKIKIRSPHSLNPILSSNISHHKSARHKKKYHKKLLSKFRSRSLGEKKIKRTSRGGYFPYCKKFKTNKTLKLNVTTLKAATEISEFLKTHKQPTVELERLKEEQESNCVLDKKCDPVSNVNCGRYNIKEAVVKLERVQFPNNLHNVVNIKQELCIPNLLDSNSNINSVSSLNANSQIDGYANDFYLDSSNADISHSENSLTQDISPKDSIALSLMDELDSNTISSDSVQYLGTVQRETNYAIKTDEFCSSTLKKCFVVLNRISV